MIFFYTTIALHLAKEIYYESWKCFFFLQVRKNTKYIKQNTARN